MRDDECVSELSRQVVRLSRSSHAMRAQIASRDATGGLEWSAYLLLFQLVREGPKRTTALAEAGCVTPSTISRQVQHLVSQELVERRADPGDGRAALLVATPAGEQVCLAMRERRDRAIGSVVADWPAEDVEALAHLLARFNDSYTTQRTSMLELLGTAPALPSSAELLRAERPGAEPFAAFQQTAVTQEIA